MDIEVQKFPHCSVITIHNKYLDAFSAKAFRAEALKVCEEGEKHIIINLQEVDFVDSSGMGAILLVYKTLGDKGFVALCGVSPRVQSVLRLLNLQNLIPVYETVEQAMQSSQMT